jgi:TatD DNase family protein
MTDAHLHLQDERLAPYLDDISQNYAAQGITRVVVNGTSENDWPRVLGLARAHPEIVIPSFGLHPWFIDDASPDWQGSLIDHLDAIPSCIGEAGLDRWIAGHHIEKQEPIFRFQIELAAERNLPLSIHCLKAWGKMLEVLQSTPLPYCGFLLHSYGGPVEMISDFAKLGAYFSFSGYYLHERKADRREALKQIPADRLLIETDAPDMSLPDALLKFPLPDKLNHPANLRAVYEGAAKVLGREPGDFTNEITENFKTLFNN